MLSDMTHRDFDPKKPAPVSPIATRETALVVAERIVKALWTKPRPLCRDCADEAGVCPTTGEACDPWKVVEAAIRADRSSAESLLLRALSEAGDRNIKLIGERTSATVRATAAESALASQTGLVEDMRERAAKVADECAMGAAADRVGVKPTGAGATGVICLSIGSESAAKAIAAAIRSLALPGISTTGGRGGWKLIDETTQKGAVFLGWGAHMGMRVLDLDDEGRPWSDEGRHPIGAFTHWRPLPRPPVEPEEDRT